MHRYKQSCAYEKYVQTDGQGDAYILPQNFVCREYNKCSSLIIMHIGRIGKKSAFETCKYTSENKVNSVYVHLK